MASYRALSLPSSSARSFLGPLATGLLVSLTGCSIDTEGLFGDSTGSDGSGGAGTTTTASSQGGASTATSTTDATSTTSTSTTTTTSTSTTSTTTSTVTSTAAGAMCGDGTLNGMEDCDGADLGGADCTDLGFNNPQGMKCSDQCTLDSSGCKAVCGNGTIEPNEECDDGNTSDALDGCNATCHALGTTCMNAIPVNLALGTVTRSGTTDLSADHFQPGNQFGCDGATGNDLVFAITPGETGFLTAWLPKQNTSFDSVLYLRATCATPASQISCNDNFGMGDNGGDVVSALVLAGQTVFLFVDGFQGDSGDFQLSLDLSKGDNCSDPVPVTVEGQGDITLLGSTTGFANDAASNAFCTNAGGGGDVVYAVTTTNPATYTFATQTTTFNSVTYARSTCSDVGTQIACSSPVGNDSSVDVTAQSNDLTFVWVDGTSNNVGAYRHVISH